MNRSGLQRLIPLILVLIVIGVAVAALISLGRTIFGGGGSSPSPTPQVNVGKQALTSTLADRSVRMTVRGPIVADENFHSYTITAAPDKRNMTTYVGYEEQQVDTEDLQNSTVSYEQFVYALDHAKLMDGTPLSGGADDVRGLCATGTLYEFEVFQGGNSLQKLWTTTCAGAPGSLKANLAQVSGLFQRQIPDYAAKVEKINM